MDSHDFLVALILILCGILAVAVLAANFIYLTHLLRHKGKFIEAVKMPTLTSKKINLSKNKLKQRIIIYYLVSAIFALMFFACTAVGKGTNLSIQTLCVFSPCFAIMLSLFNPLNFAKNYIAVYDNGFSCGVKFYDSQIIEKLIYNPKKQLSSFYIKAKGKKTRSLHIYNYMYDKDILFLFQKYYNIENTNDISLKEE